MKNFIQNLILVVILTLILLFSYAFLQNRTTGFGLSEFYHFLTDGSRHGEEKTGEEQGVKTQREEDSPYRAVWLSYLEFNAYRRSVEDNNEENFRKFFKRVLNRSKKCGSNHIIVHVRPFGDALYESGYFPWAACISGVQGESPGYDPLKIMVEMAHQNGLKIEAWINPYRVSSGSSFEELSDNNSAKIWALSSDKARNVLTYDGALYYNPSSKEVRDLIVGGVKEIVKNYDVDGIHMDDYFYPTFTAENVDSSFDSLEYQKAIQEKTIESSFSLADWRRKNVNELVSALYQTIKAENKNVTFGVSPAGNLMNLRSDLEYYADIDTWVTQSGYVDYIMPQIYWGYSNTQAPFDEMLKEWRDLTKDSEVKLYIGLQLYRMGTGDKEQSDYEELQDPSLIQKELEQIKRTAGVGGYCLFSYQYLDAGNKTYDFDSNEFSSERKKILREITKELTRRYQKTEGTMR